MSLSPLVVSGPSGSGKSTLLEKLFAKFPSAFGFSVSHTTRSSRPGEVEGKNYHYVTRDTFTKMISENRFIEHAEFSGNMYGTSYEAVSRVKETGKICVLDLEVKGVQSIKNSDMKAKFIFIKTPTVQILEERLRGRNTETEDSLQKRLQSAQEAFDYADQPGSYDVVIVNDDKEVAYKQLEDFVVGVYGLKEKEDTSAPVAPKEEPSSPKKKSSTCQIL